MKHLPAYAIPIVLVGLFLILPFLGLRPQPHRAAADLAQAARARQLGYPEHTAAHLASAAEQQPWRPDLWEQAGSAAVQAGEPQAALDYFKRARQAAGASDLESGLSTAALVDLGEAYKQTGDLHGALRAWQAAAARSGYPLDLARRILAVHLALQDYPAAAADLQTLLILEPANAEWHYRLGLLQAIDDPRRGVAYLDQAARLDPARQPALTALRRAWLRGDEVEEPAYRKLEVGRALAALQEWDLAVYALRQAVAERPDYAEAWAYLGEALQNQPPQPGEKPDPGRGLAELQRAIELDPGSLAAHTLLAVFWSRQGRPDRALQAMQAAAALEPDNPALQAQLGEALAAAGKLAEAQAVYEQAQALAPGDPAYRYLLAQFSLAYHYQVDQIALPVARRLAAENPQDAAALDLMAQVLIHQGDLANALRFLGRAIQADPEYAPARLHLGLIALLQGDHASGRRELEAALELEPAGPTADQARRLLQAYFP